MLKDLAVNEKIKDYVRKPLGSLIKEKELCANFKGNVIAVGDKVTLTCEKLGLKPKIAIIDYRIKRREVGSADKEKLKNFGTWNLKAKNPAGSITIEAWQKIQQALKEFPDEIVKIEITGEEDLLALAAILLSPIGTKVIYGQPGKGIVLVNATERKKQEIAELLIKEKAREFLQNLKGKTVIIHDTDQDGIASAVLFANYLKSRNLSFETLLGVGATIPLGLRNKIKKLNPKNLILLDFGGEARSTIKNFSQKIKVLVIDHHEVFSNDFGKALYSNPHFFNVPDNYISPTSFLSWQICKNTDWVAAIGTIGDKGFLPAKDFLRKVKKKYKGINFNYLVDLLDAADAKGEAGTAVQILLKAKKPSDLIESILADWEKEVRAEVNRIVSEHKKKAQFLANGKILFYEIKTKMFLRGIISNAIQALYPGKIVIIGEAEDSNYSMSFRTMRAKVSFPELIKKTAKNLEGAHGGGHAKAAGCKIKLKDKGLFLERFINSLNNK